MVILTGGLSTSMSTDMKLSLEVKYCFKHKMTRDLTVANYTFE